jgi:alcohol dehydrogenase/propanol-preferring alcohol dehydrogenase
MARMRAVQVSLAKGNFELVERPVPEPAGGEVRVKVQACGICHSDIFAKEGLFPGVNYPRVPGHEVVGRVDKLGDGVTTWQVGQRVGVGWHGGHCFTCDRCRLGDFITCRHAHVTGLTFDGGYAEYTVVPQQALAAVPDKLESSEAAPLMCAGVTTFNALRHSGAQPGDLVAVQGIGGLGHLAVQFAARMGFRTAAISSGPDKKPLALRLGAHEYIDARQTDPAKALADMGGAAVILATAPQSELIASVVEGLGVGGKLLIVAVAAGPLSVLPLELIGSRRSIAGWPSGHAMDSQQTMEFAALTGVRPMIETFPLDQAAAFERMLANKVRFRAVLTMP